MSSVSLQAHGVLSLVGDQTLYVTERGRLVGLLTWSEVAIICMRLLTLYILHECNLSCYLDDADGFCHIPLSYTLCKRDYLYGFVDII